MPVRSETREQISAPIDTVFDYVSDFSRWPEWVPSIRECRLGDEGALEVGARVEQSVQARGAATKPRTLDVTAVTRPQRIEFSGVEGSSPLRWGFELRTVANTRTETMLWVEIDRRGPMRAMPAPVLRHMIRKTNGKEIQAIKSKVEASLQR